MRERECEWRNLMLEPEHVCCCFISQIASHLLVFYLGDNLVLYLCHSYLQHFWPLWVFVHVEAKSAKMRMGGQWQCGKSRTGRFLEKAKSFSGMVETCIHYYLKVWIGRLVFFFKFWKKSFIHQGYKQCWILSSKNYYWWQLIRSPTV